MPTEASNENNKLFQNHLPPEVPINEFRDIGTIENVATETRVRLFKHYSKPQTYTFYTLSLVWILYWCFVLFQKLQTNTNSDDLRGYFFLISVPFLIFAVIYANFQNKILKLFMQQFAKEANLTYLYPSAKITDENGALFNLGHSKTLRHVLGGKLLNHEVQLFYYQYTVGQGKSARTFNTTVLRIKNDHVVPPILLMVDKQYFGSINPNFSDSVKIKPETDFDAQFDLYAKQKYEIEALQVFKPEFMDIMLKRWKVFNIDFSGSDIYIFTNSQIQIRVVLQNMFALGKYLLENIDPQLSKMQGSVNSLNELNPKNKY